MSNITMEYTFERHRRDKYSRQRILDELKVAAKNNNYNIFSKKQMSKIGTIAATTVVREFGSWVEAMKQLDIELRKEGSELKQRTTPPNRIYSDKELFDEMETVWRKLGHRPSKDEWNTFHQRTSYATYKNRFGSWTNACLKFIEYKMGTPFDEVVPLIKHNEKQKPTLQEIVIQTRTVPLKTRLKVLERDNFRCVYCGKSPAQERGVILHIDHIKPFSDGGTNDVNNLQTLCQQCNLGKSDDTVIHE